VEGIMVRRGLWNRCTYEREGGRIWNKSAHVISGADNFYFTHQILNASARVTAMSDLAPNKQYSLRKL